MILTKISWHERRGIGEQQQKDKQEENIEEGGEIRTRIVYHELFCVKMMQLSDALILQGL